MISCANSYKRVQWVLVCGLVFAFLFTGCPMIFRGDGGRAHRDESDRGADRSDPLAFAGDEEIVTENNVGLPDYSDISYDTLATQSSSGISADSSQIAQRYDVRLFATLNIQSARQVQQQLDTLTEMPVRVVFEEPYYKVYAGPYPTFEEAEKFVRVVTRLGFTSAWIVGRKEKVGE